MRSLNSVNKYFLKYRLRFLLGLLFITLHNVFKTLQPIYIGLALGKVTLSIKNYNSSTSPAEKELIYNDTITFLMTYGLTILLFSIISGIFLFLNRQTIIVMSRMVEFDQKNELYQHYQSLPLSFYRKNNTGDLMARISEDIGKVRMYFGPAVMYGMNMITSTVLTVGTMLYVNPILTLYVLIPLPILSITIYYISQLIEKKSTEIQESLSALSTQVQESFAGIRVIKSFAREEEMTDKVSQASQLYRDKSLELTRIQSFFQPIMIGLIGLSIVFTVLIGGLQIINKAPNADIATIAAFVMFVTNLTWPVTAIGWVTSIVQRAEASQKRLNEILSTKTDIVSTKNLSTELKGRIKFENVNFIYDQSGTVALQSISFEVTEGQSIGILGTTGSGKSTIANLICRLYDVTGGRITIDDSDIKDYSIDSLRNQIGYIPQDVFLFSDTIINNIKFGASEAAMDEVITATKNADLFENISQFPDGFDTVLGERGITLSGGQKQRVSIARALVKKPKILILDDSLSAVDTNTENAILENLKEVMKGKTTVVISHRVSSVKLADTIIVLENGQIIEQGSHEELLSHNGMYKSIYDKQLTTEAINT